MGLGLVGVYRLISCVRHVTSHQRPHPEASRRESRDVDRHCLTRPRVCGRLIVLRHTSCCSCTAQVTIKSVPRQGLSTMYCMTNVMRFQQQYLNWQIFNWTRLDARHIRIHLQVGARRAPGLRAATCSVQRAHSPGMRLSRACPTPHPIPPRPGAPG